MDECTNVGFPKWRTRPAARPPVLCLGAIVGESFTIPLRILTFCLHEGDEGIKSNVMFLFTCVLSREELYTAEP